MKECVRTGSSPVSHVWVGAGPACNRRASTEVYRVWARRFGERRLWGRVLASNAVSIPTDTFVFVLIAFVGKAPGSDVWEIVTTNIVVKGAITLISIPWIYWVRRGKEDDSQSSDRSSQSRI